MHIYIYTQSYIYRFKHVHAYIHTYIHTYVRTYERTYIHVNRCMYTYIIYIYMYIIIYIYIHRFKVGRGLARNGWTKHVVFSHVYYMFVFLIPKESLIGFSFRHWPWPGHLFQLWKSGPFRAGASGRSGRSTLSLWCLSGSTEMLSQVNGVIFW